MFTGIVENKGSIVSSTAVANGRQIVVEVLAAGLPVPGDARGDGSAGNNTWVKDCRLGASIAINGVCLTITAVNKNRLQFDVIQETLDKTTLGSKQPSDFVNLERAMQIGDRIDGHFVQGHVDGTAICDRVESTSRECVLWFKPQSQLLPYIIPKGSVAIDGVSLTIAAVDGERFSVALIPTTLNLTTLATLKRGSTVNIESDMIARCVVHSLAGMSNAQGLTVDALRKAGFA